METIDRVIFRSKHWEMFLIFVALSFIDTMIGGKYKSGIFLLLYLMILGVRLRSFLPGNFRGAYRSFRVAGVLCLALLIYIVGFRTFDGDPATIIFAAGMFVTYVIVLSFVAKGIKAIETGDNSIGFGDYFLEVVLLALFFPVGVWFLQPRLNHIGERFSL
jgi:low temperature requirement protein LtrA